MSEQQEIYPRVTRELAEQRKSLAPNLPLLQGVQSERFCRRRAFREDQAVDRRRRGARDTVSVLHPRPYPGRHAT